jgi:UDP-glucose 4-epimerase
MNILVTGGTGFIGSHTVVELLQCGHDVTIVDSLVNSDASVLDAIKQITGKEPYFEQFDIRETIELELLLEKMCIEAVIHFAALKAVGESVQKPLEYYDNNVMGLVSLLRAMNEASVNKLIFSSSATVYGDPDTLPITEEAPLKPPTNPYGATKQMAEQIITDVARSGGLTAVNLRYFNPIGAHQSGLIGELPRGIPNNLVPYVVQAAAGQRDKLTVFGNDYPTPDGSGIRDYIHVVDLAKAHVKALDFISAAQKTAVSTFNLGTGTGVSVLELIHAFEAVNGVKVPYEIGSRRPGDIAACYASADKAAKELGWKTELSLEEALRDAWRWQQHLSRTK